MRHLDLFSGIGGFAYAVDQVWPDSTHVFCDNDKFCQKVLAKHWPESKIYGDIRTLTNTSSQSSGVGEFGTSGQARQSTDALESTMVRQENGKDSSKRYETNYPKIDLLTGGFPCQPFSQAGQRRGTEDNRYLWPEMLRVISEFRPTWIIAENVRGLLTWNEGLVFEQVCTDLEGEGYEVQPFIIPACGVNAPHRRDRVWFVANRKDGDDRRHSGGTQIRQEQQSGKRIIEKDDSNTSSERLERGNRSRVDGRSENIEWNKEWVEVATELCRVDDGIPSGLDEFGGLTKARHRQERLKSLGNAIVPQVAIEIMKGITLPL